MLATGICGSHLVLCAIKRPKKSPLELCSVATTREVCFSTANCNKDSGQATEIIIMHQMLPDAFVGESLNSLSEDLGLQMNLDSEDDRMLPESSESQQKSAFSSVNPVKRPFCKGCRKAASLCICIRIKTIVDNQIGITILQHPEEKNHHLGSARIVALSLRNVEVITVPEINLNVSFRIHEKVAGSKRSISGRVGRKGRKIQVTPTTNVGQIPYKMRDNVDADEGRVLGHFDVPEQIKLPIGTGLLFPSEKALDLLPDLESEGGKLTEHPTHLIVLDGTWSKAKRIYFENPWLQDLPHYRLPLMSPSMYGYVRRQPKPGCLSTVESIVFALRLLEPQTQGLDSLLEVFDSMISDAKGFQEQSAQRNRDKNRD